MKYNAKNNPRVIIVQKIYSHLFNNERIIKYKVVSVTPNL